MTPPPQQSAVPAPSHRILGPPPAYPRSTSQSFSQELKHLGTRWAAQSSSPGLLVILAVLLILALLSARRAKKQGSWARAILDAGIKAVPAVIILLGGLMSMIIGVFYLMFLWVYLLVDFFISIFVDAFTNKPLHRGGSEYGDLGWNTALYIAVRAPQMAMGNRLAVRHRGPVAWSASGSASKSWRLPRSMRSRLPHRRRRQSPSSGHHLALHRRRMRRRLGREGSRPPPNPGAGAAKAEDLQG